MDAIQFLESKGQFRMDLGLHRIRELLKKLGNPEKEFLSIHIAGTNGKGSVSCMLAKILEKHGYKVGLYTSPHLVDFRERIQVNGKLIQKEALDGIIEKIKPLLTDETYFEIATAAAFVHFKNENVRFAIIEVGMGEKLDATNTINPEVSVITNISLEHTEHLGTRIEEIAEEKAGIIKHNIPVVTGTTGTALEKIKDMSKDISAPVFRPDIDGLNLGMRGDFQHENAMLVLKVIDILRKKHEISNDAVIHGLREAKWPGRLDFIEDDLIFDCAHNMASARTLVHEMKKLGYGKINLVLGIMRDKNIKAICTELQEIAGDVIATMPDISRAAEPEEIAKFFENATVFEDVDSAITAAERPVLVTGSIFLIGEAFRCLGLEPFQP